jgi:hypothetical protein
MLFSTDKRETGLILSSYGRKDALDISGYVAENEIVI